MYNFARHVLVAAHMGLGSGSHQGMQNHHLLTVKKSALRVPVGGCGSQGRFICYWDRKV